MSNKIMEENGIALAPEVRCDEAAVIVAHERDATPVASFALVIDDDDRICQFVAAILAELGIASATYVNGKLAVASLDERRPDIIFLDLALEQADAIDVIKWLSEKHYTGIVQLMSGGRLPLLEAVQRIGARNGLVFRQPLQKPVRADAICEVIAKLRQPGSAADPTHPTPALRG